MNGWGIVLQGSIYMNKSKALLHLHLHHFLRVPKSPIRVRWYPTILPGGESLCESYVLPKNKIETPGLSSKPERSTKSPTRGPLVFRLLSAYVFPSLYHLWFIFLSLILERKNVWLFFEKGKLNAHALFQQGVPLVQLIMPPSVTLSVCISVFLFSSVCRFVSVHVFLFFYIFTCMQDKCSRESSSNLSWAFPFLEDGFFSCFAFA